MDMNMDNLIRKYEKAAESAKSEADTFASSKNQASYYFWAAKASVYNEAAMDLKILRLNNSMNDKAALP